MCSTYLLGKTLKGFMELGKIRRGIFVSVKCSALYFESICRMTVSWNDADFNGGVFLANRKL